MGKALTLICPPMRQSVMQTTDVELAVATLNGNFAQLAVICAARSISRLGALCGNSLQFALMNGVRTFLPFTYSSDRLIVLNDYGLKVLFASHHRMMTFPMLIFHVPNIARTDVPGFTIASSNSYST